LHIESDRIELDLCRTGIDSANVENRRGTHTSSMDIERDVEV
jgi:hypothetical protein